MNLYDAEVFIQSMYPGKEITFGFDDRCVKLYEVDLTNAVPDTSSFIQYGKVKAVIQDVVDPLYFPIDPHRIPIDWEDFKSILQDLINNN